MERGTVVDHRAEKRELVIALRTANRRLATLNELFLQLASEQDPRALLEKVCHGACELIGARYGVLAVRDENERESRPFFFTACGLDAATAAGLELARLDEGILGQVLFERRARRFILKSTGDALATGLPRGLPSLQFCLAAPIMSLSSAYGWLCVAEKPGADEFGSDDEQLLATLAALAGRIFEKRSLYETALGDLARLYAEMEERKQSERAAAGRAECLNHNEREIVRLVAEGLSTSEIAAMLRLSPRTVETYRSRLMHKLGIGDLASLIKFAIRNGIASLD